MKNKFYANKVFLYFVIFLSIITGLYFVNFLTNQKISKNSQASSITPVNCSTYKYFEPPADASSKFKFYCFNVNKGKYSYGGGWGNNASCYSNIKTCFSSEKCEHEGCIRCLNQKVAPILCVNSGVAPSNILTQYIKCPPNGKLKYGWGAPGNTCYSLDGEVKLTQSGSPYCGHKTVSKALCCNNNNQPGLFNPSACCTTSSTDFRCLKAPAGTVITGACTPNKIVDIGLDKSAWITWCRYETGVKRTNGSCALGYSDTDSACSAGIGGLFRP